jgi:hypothetical protein
MIKGHMKVRKIELTEELDKDDKREEGGRKEINYSPS